MREWKEKYKELTEAEQFCVKMSEVKRLLPRLKSLGFKHHYVEMVNDTKPVRYINVKNIFVFKLYLVVEIFLLAYFGFKKMFIKSIFHRDI